MVLYWTHFNISLEANEFHKTEMDFAAAYQGKLLVGTREGSDGEASVE